MSPERKASFVRISGVCIAAFTVFLFISLFSYLFHWKEDMSFTGTQSVENAAGHLGYRTGAFFVCRCFGLGSFVLLYFLFVASMRILLDRFKGKVIRYCALTVTGALLLSLVLSYIGSFLSEAGENLGWMADVFGGGLGGRCSSLVIDGCLELIGGFTPFALAALVVIWLILASSRFNAWITADRTPCNERPAEEPETGGIVEEYQALSEDEEDVVFPEIPEEVPSDMSDTARPVPTEPAIQTEERTNGGTDSEMEVVQSDFLSVDVTRELKPINNRLDPPEGLSRFSFPPSLDLLQSYSNDRKEVSGEELQRCNNKIRLALANFGIEVTDVKAVVGPTVTLYKVYPGPKVTLNQVKRVQEDISMILCAKGLRVTKLEDSIGIEVANEHPAIVPLKSLLNDDAFRSSKAELPVAIGYTITQKVKVFDLADAPHLLIAGATKQGKSVGLNVIVSSLLYSRHPSELKFVFIDPKMVEFSAYSRLLHHYLAVLPDSGSEEEEQNNAIIKKPKDAEKTLRAVCTEMDDRYELLSRAGVNKLTLYNDKYRNHKLRPDLGFRYLPYLVVVVDEYADLTMTSGAGPEAKATGRSITTSIIRLAQKGRAAGIHVILATQRPSVDVISGLIKSNFPTRIAFRVAAKVDSQTIIDAPGAEKLIGNGDMLWCASVDTERIQCGYVSGSEIDEITAFIGDQTGFGRSYNTPYYLPVPEEAEGEGGGLTDMSDLDERFSEAAELVVTTQKASTSYLQTRLGMGFAKAARVMGQLEAAGIVGPQDGAKPRQVLVPDLNSLRPILDSFVK